MAADYVQDDEVNGIFSQVMEHQDKNITTLWTKAEAKINPILACFEERSEDDGGGRGFITRVGIQTGSSVSPSYAKAAAKASGSTLGNSAINGRWVSHPLELNIVAQWTRKAMNAARGDGPGQVYDVIAKEREAKIALARHRLAVFAVESGWGRISTVVSISTGNLTFTVTPSEVNRFRKGDDIVFAQYESTGALRSATPWTVAGVTPRTSTITLSARSTDKPYDTDGVRNGDTVFWDGYRENASSPTKLCMDGLGSWVPATEPSDTFHGISRANSWELGGLIFDASAGGQLTHAEAVLEMAGMATQYGTQLDAIYFSVPDYNILCRNKDATKAVQIKMGPYEIGFSGVTVQGGSNGEIPVIPDAYLKQGQCIAGPWNDKELGPKLKHVRQLINVDNADGCEFLRLYNSTGYEQRMYFDGQGIIAGPGKYIRGINLPTS